MGAIRQYIFQLVSASILCSVVLKFTQGIKVAQQLIKTLCGIIISLVVISPLIDISPLSIPEVLTDVSSDGKYIASQASKESDMQLHSVIIKNTEAYIINKAAIYDCALEVHVSLESEVKPIPASVVLKGDVSPYTKQKIEEIIEQDVGIPKEQQIWN